MLPFIVGSCIHFLDGWRGLPVRLCDGAMWIMLVPWWCISRVGLTALIAAMIVGPRLEKYARTSKKSWLFEFGRGDCYTIPGHNVSQMMLGVFILYVCFYGFNVGSVLVGTLCEPTANVTAREMIHVLVNDLPTTTINVTLSMAGGILGAMFGGWLMNKKPDPLTTGNGAIAGMVSICAGVGFTHPGFAIVVGIISGGIIPLVVKITGQDRD